MNRFWKFILIFLPLSIVLSIFTGLPNIFQIIIWPFAAIGYYGLKGFGYLLAAAFGLTLGNFWWVIIILLILSRIPIIGAPITWLLKLPFKLIWGMIKGTWQRREKRQKARRALTLGLAGLKKRFNALIRSGKFLRDTPAGREPQVIRENRLLFHMLANYTTRSEITYRYWGFVKQAKRVGTEVIEEKIEKHTNQEALRGDIIATRSGGVTEEGAHFEGWNRLNVEATELINEFFYVLYMANIATMCGLKEKNVESFRIENGLLTDIKTRADDLIEKMMKNKEQYKIRMDAYGGHNVLKAYRNIILSMTNVTGDILEHPQLFARPGAEFDMGDQTGKPKKAGRDARGLPTDEVNQYGEVVEDINEQKKNDKFGNIDPRDYKKPRKVKPHNIINYPDFTTFIGNIELDWKGLAEDIRYGQWHPDSRTYDMYKRALTNAIYPEWADNQIPTTGISPPGTGEDVAFDMRAMADPGKNVYWGRERFDSDSPPIRQNPFHNPYPLVSSLGIKQYLQQRLRTDMKDKALAEEFLNKYPADTGAPEKLMEHGEVKVPIGTTAGDAPTEFHKGRGGGH